MNRIAYLLKAKTQYNIHSPFVFELYNNVLATKLSPKVQQEMGTLTLYKELTYKLQHYYHTDCQPLSESQNLLTQQNGNMHMLVVAKPHKDTCSEKEWEFLKSQWPVSIDLYDIGLLVNNPKLHPQHFLLRTWRLF